MGAGNGPILCFCTVLHSKFEDSCSSEKWKGEKFPLCIVFTVHRSEFGDCGLFDKRERGMVQMCFLLSFTLSSSAVVRLKSGKEKMTDFAFFAMLISEFGHIGPFEKWKLGMDPFCVFSMVPR